MVKMVLNKGFLFLVTLLVFSWTVFGQSGSTVGIITGHIKDSQGAALVGATVKALRMDTNIEYTATSDEKGDYQFIHLPPSTYKVQIQVEGFSPKEEQIFLSLGSTAVVSFSLGPAGTKDVIEVKATNDPINSGKTENSTNVRREIFEGLPLNQRNLFLDFALTTARITPDGLPLQGITATSGLSFNGQPARFNNFTIDGLDNNDTTAGLVRSGFGQDAIQEFQVVSDSYSAEFGRALGGIMNLVTRSGTNQLAGTAFFTFRNDTISARNVLLPKKPPFKQYQYGVTLGGPIQRDRAFFFASVERLNLSQSNIVRFDDRILGAFRRVGLIVHNGPVPFSIGTLSGLVRADWQINSSNQFMARFNLGGTQNSAFDQSFENSQFADERYPGTQRLDDQSLVLSNTYTNPGKNLVNETRFLFNRRDQQAIAPDPSTAQVNLQSPDGVLIAGPSSLLPQSRDSRTFQLVNQVSLGVSRHLFKFGVDLLRINTTQRQPTDELGRITFGGLDLNYIRGMLKLPGEAFFSPNEAFDPALRTPSQRAFLKALSPLLYRFSLNPNFPRNIPLDDFPLPRDFTQSFQPQTPLDVTQTFVSLFAQDDFKWKPNFMIKAGIRYDLFRTRFIPDNKGNFSPRIGLAYRLNSVPNLGFRAGYGLFYAAPITSPVFFSDRRTTLILAFPDAILPLGSPSLRLPISSQLPRGGAIAPQLSSESLISPQFKDGYAQQTNFGMDYQLGKTTISANYVYVRGEKILSVRNANPVVRPIPGNLTASRLVGRVDPTRGDVFIYESAYDSYYHAVTIAANRQFSNRIGFLTHYTFSKTIDDFVDFRTNFQELSNYLDLRSERALSVQDLRHRFVISGVWNLDNGQTRWLRGLQLSGIFTAQSGRPFNLLSGADLKQTGNFFSRPLVVGPDGVSREIGRNTGIAPGFSSFDFRLTRTITLGERLRLVALAEVFNLFNRTNISVFNRIFLPDPKLIFRLPPQEGGRYVVTPERYQQALPPRQFQFSVRVVF